jgi:hypothetical protein
LDITPSNYWQIIHRSKLLLIKCIEKHWMRWLNWWIYYCFPAKRPLG